MIEKKLVGTCNHKGNKYVIERDQYGKFYVTNNDVVTIQSKLNATQVVCWLLHVMNNEI